MDRVRLAIEQAIVREVITLVTKAGFSLAYVDNGGAEEHVETVAQAIEHVFSVDEARVVFKPRPGSGAGGNGQWIDFVLGNGVDVLSNHTILDPLFDKLLDGFDAEDVVVKMLAPEGLEVERVQNAARDLEIAEAEEGL